MSKAPRVSAVSKSPRVSAVSKSTGVIAVPADFIYLASQSPRRRHLLEQLGVRHELLLPTADEDAESL